jgi:o-succinylbenzoate synthase
MQIKTLTTHPYTIPLVNGQIRQGLLLKLTDEFENQSCGDIAPLPKRSRESLRDVIDQLQQKQRDILRIDWTPHNFIENLQKLCLFPSVIFGLESALLTLLSPLDDHTIQTSALFMGTFEEIMEQSQVRALEGYTSAKLKVSQLNFRDAERAIYALKDKFRLRIDVNRAWTTSESLHFFRQFSLDCFDYVEEPFENPHDLFLFTHPFAVDESFPDEISYEQLESLPQLKAVIYKPTIQGGLTGCLQLHEWCVKRGVQLVLSSSFESEIGLAHIVSMAHRLSISAPVGVGTVHF